MAIAMTCPRCHNLVITQYDEPIEGHHVNAR